METDQLAPCTRCLGDCDEATVQNFKGNNMCGDCWERYEGSNEHLEDLIKDSKAHFAERGMTPTLEEIEEDVVRYLQEELGWDYHFACERVSQVYKEHDQ